MRYILFGLLLAGSVLGQKYKGPVPEKPDVPYIIHGDTLLATDVSDAKEETRKDLQVYWVPGTEAAAKTPLAGPMFLIQTEKLAVDRIQMYPFEIKNGRREVAINPKKPKDSAKPARLNLTKMGDNLFRIEVVDSLPAGEYGLTPDGSNQVFCFAIF
jgi:hypothetical protein